LTNAQHIAYGANIRTGCIVWLRADQPHQTVPIARAVNLRKLFQHLPVIPNPVTPRAGNSPYAQCVNGATGAVHVRAELGQRGKHNRSARRDERRVNAYGSKNGHPDKATAGSNPRCNPDKSAYKSLAGFCLREKRNRN